VKHGIVNVTEVVVEVRPTVRRQVHLHDLDTDHVTL
jgi:hypothetical protein